MIPNIILLSDFNQDFVGRSKGRWMVGQNWFSLGRFLYVPETQTRPRFKNQRLPETVSYTCPKRIRGSTFQKFLFQTIAIRETIPIVSRLPMVWNVNFWNVDFLIFIKSKITFEVKYIFLSFEIIFESIIQISIIKISQNDEEN